MKIIVPENEKVAEIILVVEPISENGDISSNFLYLSKFMLKELGLKSFSQDNCNIFFKSKNFFKYLMALYNIYTKDKEYAQKKQKVDFPFKHLESQISKIIKSVKTDDELKVSVLPKEAEQFSFKTITQSGKIQNVNINIEEGPDFTNGQKFVNISMEDRDIRAYRIFEQLYRYGKYAFDFIFNAQPSSQNNKSSDDNLIDDNGKDLKKKKII